MSLYRYSNLPFSLMLVTTTNNLFEKQQTFYTTKDTLVSHIRKNERGPVQLFEQVNFFNRAFLDIEKIDPVGFEESAVFRIADLFTRYVEKVIEVDLKNSSFIVTKNNASLSFHVIFSYALDNVTLRAIVALFKALYPWAGVIDDVVYSPGRLFKCVGSIKPGMSSTAPEDPETYHVVIRPCGARIPLKELSDEEIAASLISNLEGADVISLVDVNANIGTDRNIKSTRTLDGGEITLSPVTVYFSGKSKYTKQFSWQQAITLNNIFSLEKISNVEFKSGFVKYEDYIDLRNYHNNYNLRLGTTEGLKVYDKDLNEITEGLDKLLLRCLLSRDITLKVKYDDYIALSVGSLRSLTWAEYRDIRNYTSSIGKTVSRGFRTVETAVVNYIRSKFVEAGVSKELIEKRSTGRTCGIGEPKLADAKAIYSLSEISEKIEFLCLENDRYNTIDQTGTSVTFRDYPSWYFTTSDSITKQSNAMFKLFTNNNRKIKDHRNSSYVNPYARSPQNEDSDDSGDDSSDSEEH